MNSRNGEAAWTTRAPAKVNLDLRMRGLRADGYHLLSTVLQTIGLADTLTLRAADGPFSLSCDTPGVPTDARNLAWQGAAAMAAALGVSLDGWHLHLDKQVPAEAGLGGGSSDAAAAARLVARASGAHLAATDLADVIRPLGADVAFFAWGGTMRGEGVGDELTPLPDMPGAGVLLVRPAFGVSTREAYGWYDADAAARPSSVGSGSSDVPARSAAGAPRPRTAARVPLDPDDALAWAGCANDLERPVAARHPEIGAIVGRLRDAGAWLAAMSGSGSACFGLFDPTLDLSAVQTGWPAGTRVWRTHLLSRAAYGDLTTCRPARSGPQPPVHG